jgi:hypothetical protein
MTLKSHRIRIATKVNTYAEWPHASFAGFESPYSDALRKAFPPALLAEHIARLPPESRARLAKQFGPLPTTQTPHP